MNLNSKRNNFFGKIILIIIVLAITSSNAMADCGQTINMKQGTSSSINMGNYLGYGNTPGNDLIYVPVSSLLFGKSDTTFRKDNMTAIFLVQGENSAAGYAMSSSTYNSKNIWNDYDCSYIYRAGSYIYGSISGLQFDMVVDGRYQDEYDWLGFRTEAHEKADGYAAGQLYYLSYSTDVTKLKSMMNDAYQYSVNLNYDYSWRNRFLGNLLSQPYSYPIYMKLIEGGSVSESYNVHTGYGVYYLAVAGGIRNRNDEHWDDYKLSVNIKSGDYVVSPTILKTSSEVRNAFSNAGKLSLFESQPNMCALVGEHITTKGINPTSGTKCCGGSLNPDNDIGKTSLQYVCRKDTSVIGGRYYWESICSKSASYASLPASEKTLYDTYCKCLGGSSECTCSGELKLFCSGTYSCSGLSQAECGSFSGCGWNPTYTRVCPTGDGSIYQQYDGIVQNDFNLPNGESFGLYESFAYPIDDGSGCYNVESGGSCEPNGASRSCSGISNSVCRDYPGCNLLDSNGGWHYSETESCLQYKDLTSCSARQSCSWEPRKDAGGSCSQNSDCKPGLQCDPGFDSTTTDCTDPAAKCFCHSTETTCVVDSSGIETAVGAYACSNKEYKRCSVATGLYDKNSDGTGEFCTTTNGFSCTGSPTQTCIGSGSCYGISRQATCNTYASDGCTWNEAVEGPCYNRDYACSDPTQDTMVKNIKPTSNYLSNQESFGSLNIESFYIPPGSCGCTGLDQFSCEMNSADCYWYSQSAYCSGSVDCADYSSGNCPSWAGCYALTTCTEQSYANCQYGCQRSCNVYKYDAPVDIHSNNNACSCYNGGSIKTCYFDGDGDNYPTSATANYCSTNGVNERIGNYICNTNNLNDCNDGDASITRTTYYRDADGDGYGNSAISNTYCSLAEANAAGYVDNPDDCNDGNAAISPADPEICNNIDDNCDGYTDNANSVQVSNSLTQTGSCSQNGVCSGAYQTCNSGSWGACSILPTTEIACNGIDEDCNGADLATGTPWYRDSDNDGYGNSTGGVITQCAQPAGYVADNTDCNDASSSIWRRTFVYTDFDNDNYNSTGLVSICYGASIPAGYKLGGMLGSDCNDSNNQLNVLRVCYADLDNDNYANLSKSANLCALSTPNLVTAGPDGNYICNYNGVNDCDDSDGTVAADCLCKSFIVYNTRIGFPALEYPKNNFKTVNTPSVIDSACSVNSVSPAYIRFNKALVTGGVASPVDVPNPLVRSMNLPPCSDFASVTTFCQNLGYSASGASTTTTGSCAAWVGSSWTTVASGSRVSTLTCTFSSLRPEDKLVLTMNDTDGTFKPAVLNCTSKRFAGVTTNGPDGVCIDNFVPDATPLCGNDANGRPVDPDCGVHTFMTHGTTRLIDNSVVNINPSVPSPTPHMACGTNNANDCVTNIGGQTRCTAPGTLIYTGKDQDNQDKNITCSAQKTWCYDGYTFQNGRCEATFQDDCYIADCPALSTYKQLPDDSIKVDSTIYNFNNEDCGVVRSDGTTAECNTATTQDLGTTSTTTYIVQNPYGGTCECDSLSGVCDCTATNTCVGSNIEVCDIKSSDGFNTVIGKGIKTRTCSSGTWSDWSSCRAKYCNKQYALDNGRCVYLSTSFCAGGELQTSGTSGGTINIYDSSTIFTGKIPCQPAISNAIGEKSIVCGYSLTGGNWNIASESICEVKGCFYGYEYRDGVCVQKTQSGGTYTYTIKQPLYREKLTVASNLSDFIKDPDCTIRIGTKINGVCVASQTFPEYKYTIENVIIK